MTRLGEDRYRFVGGAPTRRRDFTWISRHAAAGYDVTVEDVTADDAVIGLMGPLAAAILSAACETELSAAACPFGTSREVRIGGVAIRACRVSFIGEFGWELYIPADQAIGVYDLLREAGRPHDLASMGLYAVDCCRMEKGIRHWSHDIGPDDTPLEAGLGFAVAWDKPGGFAGRDALAAQKAEGPRRRLVQFKVADGHPLLLHDEPIYRDGGLAGRTSSGARGFRTGLSLCMGYLGVEPGETVADIVGDRFEIGVAGERFAMEALSAPPYDPRGARMRG